MTATSKIRAIDPFLKWAGGKRWLTKSQNQILPTKYGTYMEPFVGGGAVFFLSPSAPFVISDTNKDLINCYKAIRDNARAVRKILEHHQKNHGDDYYYRVREYADLDCIQEAAKFIYLNRTCWNGLYRVNLKGKFNVPKGTKTKVVFDTDDFEAVAEKLLEGRIICQDFEHTIELSKEGDFIFIDPPYTVAHNLNAFVKYNEKIFSWNDQKRLRDAILRAVERGVLITLTNADHESVVDLYEGIGNVERVSRFSVISGKNNGRRATTELLIRFNWNV